MPDNRVVNETQQEKRIFLLRESRGVLEELGLASGPGGDPHGWCQAGRSAALGATSFLASFVAYRTHEIRCRGSPYSTRLTVIVLFPWKRCTTDLLL